jgi:hypothetical protein
MKFGEILDSFRLYRPLKKIGGYFFDSRKLQSDLDVAVDLWRLKQGINSWSRVISNVDAKFSAGNLLIISMTNIPFLAKAHALLAVGLRERGYRPYILCSSGSRWAHRYFALFGIRDLIFWDRCLVCFAPEAGHVDGVVDEFLASNPTIQDFKNWQFHGVYVGKLALSTMIRREMRGQFDFNDPTKATLLRKWLWDTINYVLVAEKMLAQYPVQKMIVRDAGYIPNGVIYEVGLNRGTDAIRFESAQMMGQWMVKRYSIDTRGQALFSISPDTWERLHDLPLTGIQEQALTADFIERYDPGSKRDLYQYQQGKHQLSRKDVIASLNLDPRKKTAAVFAHISWDANFFDGEDVFDDFEHWLVETVRIACDNTNLNWVIKLHPANVYKLRREGKEMIEEVEMVALHRLWPLPGHIKIMHADTPINTWSLFPVIDYGLTVRGTIGMELPCFGIPTVTAGTGRYNDYGFTIDPKTRTAYRDLLLSLHTVPRLDARQVELARRHAYWVFLHRQASFDEFSKMSTKVLEDPGHPLHHNLTITTRLPEGFQDAPQFQAFMDWLAGNEGSDFIHQSQGSYS